MRSLACVVQIQIPVTQSAGNYLLLCMYLAYPILRTIRERDYALEVRATSVDCVLRAYELQQSAQPH